MSATFSSEGMTEAEGEPKAIRICGDGIISWCLAHGYTIEEADALENDGIDSFTTFSELDEEDKREIAETVLKLSKRKTKVFLHATDEDAIAAFAKGVDMGHSFKEYRHALQATRRAKLAKSAISVSIDSKLPAAFAGESGDDDDEKEGLPSVGSRKKVKRRMIFPPGLSIAPHRIITLDREKAMRENPAFKPRDFCTLADLDYIKDKDLKIILVVGASGSGKSTMINSLVNYLHRVEFEDPWRLKLIRESSTRAKHESQTDQVFGYFLESPPAMKGSSSLLIIDTPGFGDTRGPWRDDETVAELREFFTSQVLYLNAICFVVKSTDDRLGPLQKRIFDQILGLFGKDIDELITILFTFCDADAPPALEVLKGKGITFGKAIKLNNSAFFLKKKTPTDVLKADTLIFDQLFWGLGCASFKQLIDHVCSQKDVSLKLTRKVLQRRNELRVYIENIRKKVDIGLSVLDGLEQTLVQVEKFRLIADESKDFTYMVTSWRMVKKKKETKYNTVCDVCRWTCHEDCGIEQDGDKSECVAMKKDSGTCMHCPKKCKWNLHCNRDYYYVKEEFQEERTRTELQALYVHASSQKSEYDQIVDGLREDFEEAQKYVYRAIGKTRKAVRELKRIALRPNVMLEDEYFDLMILQESNEGQYGWQRRVDMLKKLKARSKYLAKVMDKEWDPFQERLEQTKRELAARGSTVDVGIDRDAMKSKHLCGIFDGFF